MRIAATRPDRLHTLTVVSSPHPRAVVGAMLTSRQLLQAWHVGFFPLPWLPEAAIRPRGGRFAVALLKHSGLGADLAKAYADRLINDPGGLAGALRWYRAMPLDISIGGRAGAITVPTTYVWSTDDAAIGRRAAQLTSRWVTGPFEFKVLEGVSHWIPEQVPDKTGRVHPGTDQERVVAGDLTRRVTEVDKLSMGTPRDPPRHSPVRIK